MRKNNFQKLSSGDLDKLLNQAFLDLDPGEAGNEAMLETIGNRVLVKQHSAAAWMADLFSNKFFFALSILSFAASVYHWQNFKRLMNEQTVSIKPVSTPKEIKKEQQVLIPKEIPGKNEDGALRATVNVENPLKTITGPEIEGQKQEAIVSESVTAQPEAPLVAEHKNSEINEELKEQTETTSLPEKYIFPNLTQKQIKENQKEIKWLVKIATRLKQDKSIEKYCRIPASPDKSIPEFYMASGEITNLAYRTFLFDLLINERREEFLIAKPHQALWMNAGGVNYFDTLSAVYFSSERYDFYPVVNIPVAGARMYCEWLTVLVNAQRQKEGKRPIQVRLPYEKEWLYAASVGHKDAVYPWFTDSIQNDQNKFLANFCIRKQSDQLKQPVFYPNGFNPNAYTAAGLASNNVKAATIETWSYHPNDFQLYNMCGNVSELVYTENNTIKTKGGNWNSDFEHLKLNSDDEFKGAVKPSPMIGFRVCITEQR